MVPRKREVKVSYLSQNGNYFFNIFVAWLAARRPEIISPSKPMEGKTVGPTHKILLPGFEVMAREWIPEFSF